MLGVPTSTVSSSPPYWTNGEAPFLLTYVRMSSPALISRATVTEEEEDVENCTTPKYSDQALTPNSICPPAPRKPRTTSGRKNSTSSSPRTTRVVVDLSSVFRTFKKKKQRKKKKKKLHVRLNYSSGFS